MLHDIVLAWPRSSNTCTKGMCASARGLGHSNIQMFCWPAHSVHVATSCNHVAGCCIEMLRAFGQALILWTQIFYQSVTQSYYVTNFVTSHSMTRFDIHHHYYRTFSKSKISKTTYLVVFSKQTSFFKLSKSAWVRDKAMTSAPHFANIFAVLRPIPREK